MSTINWKNETRKVADLVPADYNPRRISDKEKADLEYSLQTWGYVVPVQINTGERNNILIGGHQRVAILAALGRMEEEIDVRVPDRELSIEEEMELNISLNRMGGQFDWEKLFKNFDMDTLLRSGFENEELSKLWDDVDLIDDLDHQGEPPEPDEEIVPRMQLGDIFILKDEKGIEHRVMHGDSTNPEHVAQVMKGWKADMIYCDPPYNIGLDYNSGIGQSSHYGGNYTGKKDSKTNDDYRSFVAATMANAVEHAKKDAHVFYWCDERYIGMMQDLMAQNKVVSFRVCLWVKNNANITPQVAFSKVYEPCVYGTLGKPYLDKRYTKYHEVLNPNVETGKAVLEELTDMFNIWAVSRDNTSDYEHPTQKPLNLHQKPLRRCTAAGHVVLDLFGGSGSTMMACQQMGRRSACIEFDPIFCEKILRRWERFTGRKAEKI